MKIELIAIGKTSFPFVGEGIRIYFDRINKYVKSALKILPDIKNSSSLTQPERKKMEASVFKKEIQPGSYIVLLDEKGKELNSNAFAGYIQGRMNSGIKVLTFIVGGPYGFSEEMHQLANDRISLSKLTFPHDLVRLIFAEQLYRALTILKGEKYHHD